METKNISNMSQKETKIRKTTIIFGSIVVVLTYVWAILYVFHFTAGQTIHLDALIYVQMFIYLFVLVTLGLLITIVVYDGKRMKSSKESIIIFAISLTTAIVVLVFSAIQLPQYMAFIIRYDANVAHPKWMYNVFAATLLAISCNFVLVRNTGLKERQRILKPISNCLAVLLGLAVIPFVFGIAQNWLSGAFKDAFGASIYFLEIAMFQLICILLIIKLIMICFDKQGKQIVMWSILLGIALLATIWVIFYANETYWIVRELNIYFLIISSAYMMSMPITYLCLNKKEKQIDRRKHE